MDNVVGVVGAEPSGQAQDMVGLPSRLRIVTVFAMWWEELSNVLFTNTIQATRCLHHLARILEDAAEVGDKKPDSQQMIDDDDEELEMLNVRLVKIVINEFGDVAESTFRHMTSATDAAFLRAGMRFLIAYKLACWRTFDDFYIIYQADLLESFLSENANTTDILFAARLAFLAGELIDETDAQSPIAPTDILDRIITRFRDSKQAIESRVDEVKRYIDGQVTKVAYINDGSIQIPVPGDAQSYSAEWDTDTANDVNSIEHQLSIVVGNLRLLGAIASYTEVLYPCIEAGMVQSCLDLLKLPHFALQIYAMGWFSEGLIHKKIGIDFVELGGIAAIKEFISEWRDDKKKFSVSAPYASYILVALSKHSQAMEALFNGNSAVNDGNGNSSGSQEDNSERIAEEFISFGLDLLQDDSVDTQLNIVEWLGECFSFPILLKIAYTRNILQLLGEKLKLSLVIEQSEDKSLSLKSTLRKETVRSILKFVSVNLFWAVQYSKSISAESLLDTKNHSSTNSLTTSGKLQGFGSPSKKYFSFNLSGPSNDGISSKDGSSKIGGSGGGSWVNGISTVVKVNDDDLVVLEAFVQQALIKGGTLPIGLTTDLFDTGIDLPSKSDNTSEKREIRDDDTITSFASQACLRNKVLPEWNVAKLFIKYNLIPIMLKAFIVESKDATVIAMLLLILELLCLDAAMILELQYQQPINIPSAESIDSETNALQGRKGLEIILASIGTPARKDPSVISSTLRLLSAMCTPPQFRYKGTSIQAAKSLLDDFVAITASSTQPSNGNNINASAMKKRFDTSVKKVYVFQRDLNSDLEQVQKSIRTAIRSYSGINSLMQLIYYKKNQLYAISIRLETVKVLLGIAQDNEIKLILSKMRIPTILENQVRAETNQMNYLEINYSTTNSNKSTEKHILEFYCEILSSLLNNSINDTTITERNLDATQDALERKAIVDHSHIDYHESELMQLIKEHLIAKGLTKTVSLLEQELIESENSIGNELIHSNQSQGLKTPHNDNRKRQRDSLPPIGGTSVLSSSHPHQSSPYDTNTNTTNAMDESTEHDLYLWKDTSLDPTIDTEVFDQRYVQHFKVYANGTATSTGNDDDDRETLLFTSEAFNPSGRQIAALHAGADSVSGVNDNGMSNTCTAYILDVETGAVLQTISNTGNENTYLVPTLNYVNHDENLLIMDGKLYDIRQSTNVLPIHRFDKLSFAGNTAIHPYKYEIIIDNAIWDLRNCSILKQTVPLLDNCKIKFDGTGNVLFGYRSLDEERDDLKLNMNHSVQDNNFFHVLNAQDYSHLHTESIEKENMLLWDLDVDRYGAGYLSTLMFSNHFSESMCRIFEIGKRKKTLGDGDSDDEEDEDDNDADWDSQQDGIDEDMDTVHGDDDDDDDDDSNGTDESDADDDIDDSTVEDSDDEMEIIDDDDDEEEDDNDDNYEDFDEDDEDDEDYSPAGEGRQNEDDEDGWETMSEEDS